MIKKITIHTFKKKELDFRKKLLLIILHLFFFFKFSLSGNQSVED